MQVCSWQLGKLLITNKPFYLIAKKMALGDHHAMAFTTERETMREYQYLIKTKVYSKLKLYKVHDGRYELIEEYTA